MLIGAVRSGSSMARNVLVSSTVGLRYMIVSHVRCLCHTKTIGGAIRLVEVGAQTQRIYPSHVLLDKRANKCRTCGLVFKSTYPVAVGDDTTAGEDLVDNSR